MKPNLGSSIAVGWMSFGVALLTCLFLFLGFPWLLSAHNDGLLILAFVVLGVGVTVPIVFVFAILIPFLKGKLDA